jgi:hypothetical protein
MDDTRDIKNRFHSRRRSLLNRFCLICILLTTLIIIQAACTPIELTPVSVDPGRKLKPLEAAPHAEDKLLSHHSHYLQWI